MANEPRGEGGTTWKCIRSPEYGIQEEYQCVSCERKTWASTTPARCSCQPSAEQLEVKVAELEKEIQQLKAGMRPMSSAPKDGSEFVAVEKGKLQPTEFRHNILRFDLDDRVFEDAEMTYDVKYAKRRFAGWYPILAEVTTLLSPKE